MKITKTITFDIDQWSLIEGYLESAVIACEEVNEFNDYDEKINKLQNIIDKIDSAKSEVLI